MSKLAIPQPIVFQVRPANRGINVSAPPQDINSRESPRMMNVRFKRGQILFRSGFKLKYRGCRESIMWLDVARSGDSTIPVAIGSDGIYYISSGVFKLMPVYDGVGGTESYPYFTTDPEQHVISMDTGEGKYDFVTANSGALFPTSGYDHISVFCNMTSDGLYAVAYTGETDPVECEKIVAAGAPSLCRAVAIFDNRVVALGTEDNSSEVRWSAKGRFDWWDPGEYEDAGSEILGDSPDRIQAGMSLGEYLVIYKEKSIHLGRKSLLTDPAIRFDPASGQDIGLAAAGTLGDIRGAHLFLGSDDVYRFSLQGIEPIGTRIKQDLFHGENGILPEYIQRCVGAIAKESNEYWLFVPSGKWPDNGGAAIENLLLNPQMWDDDSDDEPDDWTVDFPANGTIANQVGIGIFGNHTSRLTHNSGTTFGIKQVWDAEEVIADRTYSVMVWCKVDGASNLVMHAYSLDGDGLDPTWQMDSIVPLSAGTDFGHTYASFTVTNHAEAEQLEIQLRLYGVGVNLDIDAVDLVEITDVKPTHLVQAEGAEWFKAPAYINGMGEKQMIPLIIDKVGKWLPDTCWVFNYEENAWSCWRLPLTGFGYDSLSTIVTIGELEGTIAEQTWRFDEKHIEAFAPTSLIAQCDGNVYEVSTAVVSDWGGVLDQAYMAYWESKDFDLGRPEMDKTASRLLIFHETSHPPVVVTVAVSTNSGLTWSEQNVTMRQGFTVTFADFEVTGSQVRFRVKAQSSGFIISGYAVKVIPRGESYAY